jgi:aminobenzoyl-glutamate utilization protein B
MQLLRHTTTIALIVAAGATLGAQRQAAPAAAPAAPPAYLKPSPRIDALKKDVVAEVEKRFELTQQMVDSLFSFSELGFQEFETQKYVTAILEKEGFTVERGVAGIPTSWVARWGSGKPVISFGTDIDGIPQANQKPGVVTRDELVPGAPGHGEGHSTGQALIVTAALAVKAIMEREKIPGTLMLWPGVAEEQLATKAYLVRAGVFKDVDAVLYAHVGNGLGTSWGDRGGSGLVSVEYMFRGSSSHAAGAPWAGRSALDAVELMNAGWNAKREHLRLAQRSHYVITDGGDQPNVVPSTASVWYYFRETDYDRIKQMWEWGDNMAKGAALMTGTEWTSRVLGSAWPGHGNRAIAQAMHANIVQVGMPQWTEADQQFARAFQRAMGSQERGLTTEVNQTLTGRELIPDNEKTGGTSDDIGDVMWSVPTASLSFPSNVSGGTGHHWSAAIAEATPVAHKGSSQGAKVHAMTALDLLLRPELVAAARDYFDTVQGKQRTYQPLIRPEDQPAIWLNKEIMDRFRPALQKFYYDPTKYKTYLEQLGVQYPPPMPPAPSTGAQQ